MYVLDILKLINLIYSEYKVKMYDSFQNLFAFYSFDEILTRRKPNVMTFSITGTKIFSADFILST